MRIIFATGNEGKLKEIKVIMGDLGMDILSMKEAGIKADIVEDGKSFTENALIKARAISDIARGELVMADDSGLVIDALNGEPGIYSARYMGEDTSYDIKNKAILDRLKDGFDEFLHLSGLFCRILEAACYASMVVDIYDEVGHSETVFFCSLEGQNVAVDNGLLELEAGVHRHVGDLSIHALHRFLDAATTW